MEDVEARKKGEHHEEKHEHKEHPVCAKACDALPKGLKKYRGHCVKGCESMEPPLDVVQILATAADTSNDNIEKVFAFIAREATAAKGEFPSKEKIGAYAIHTLKISAKGFHRAATMVEMHMKEVEARKKGEHHEEKHEHKEHPVCAKACDALPKKLKKYRGHCVKGCESMEPPLDVVQILATAAGTSDENIEKVFAFIAKEAVEHRKFPSKEKIGAYAIGTLKISEAGFHRAANMVEMHMKEVEARKKEDD